MNIDRERVVLQHCVDGHQQRVDYLRAGIERLTRELRLHETIRGLAANSCSGLTGAAAFIFLAFWAWQAEAANAPNPPGAASTWAPAVKEFVGTSATNTSRVYFTGAQGILTEIFYPTADMVQNVDLQFLITDANRTWGDEERKQPNPQVSLVNNRALTWRAVTTDGDGRWRVTKTIFSDPDRHAVVQRVIFEALEPGKTVSDYNVYLLNNPAINNAGGGEGNNGGADNSRTLSATGRTLLVASQPNSTSSAIAISLPWKMVGGNQMVSSGFVDRNDGWTDLFGGSNDRTMNLQFDGAFGGNVAQIGWIDFGGSTAGSISLDVVLAFGANESEAMATANSILSSDLSAIEQKYTNEWITYTTSLNPQGGLADDQYYVAAMVLKTSQDKSNGAMVAGPGTPWGEDNNDSNSGGYHLVWSRDLFKFASALLTAGDSQSANRAVEYLFNVQMRPDGRFPQNSWVNGEPYWRGLQMDEVAMPIILAWKLGRSDLWLSKIKTAAEFLAQQGPRTDQDRWEEMAGFSPSTIAAEIAGLVSAASLANSAGDPGAAAFYLKKADEWRNNVANWTFTTTGLHGNGRYYVRITDNADPNDNIELCFKNCTGRHGERWIVDGGFLELVRMGVMSPGDWTIRESVAEYDALIGQRLPTGDAGCDSYFQNNRTNAWFRYNYDGYGEYNDGRSFGGCNGSCAEQDLGRGRLWPIFTAERGIYEISRSGQGTDGACYQRTLKAFSSPAGLIPEQLWNISANVTGWQTLNPGFTPGTATRSIRPLNWAMGEYINLVAAMNAGRNDAPSVVCQRYACDKPQVDVSFTVTANTVPGEDVYLVGDHALLSTWAPESGIKLSPAVYPNWNVTVSLPANTPFAYKFVKRDSAGNTNWETGSSRNFTTPASGSIVRSNVFSN